MLLNLREIIEVPDAGVPFECRLGTERLDFPALVRFVSEPEAKGEVRNSAGVLTLTAVLRADMIVTCDRCSKEFESTKTMDVTAVLASQLEDEDNPDIFLLEGDCVDLDDVLSTCFILDMDSKFLCREDCKGLCPDCGADLNLGPCKCGKKLDPRMAVLEQLLDDK